MWRTPAGIRILEDSIITYHTTLSNLAVILDMEHGEASGILVEVIHRAVLATHYPVNVHLEEYIFRDWCVAACSQHQLLVFHFLEFMGMIVVTVFQTGSLAALATSL